jgi:hypothetical protein
MEQTTNKKEREETKKEREEGPVAEKIESQTSKIPSDVFLWSGLATGAMAIGLHCVKQKHLALLVGQWVAPILLMGIYNKLVKQSGHDMNDESDGEQSRSSRVRSARL